MIDQLIIGDKASYDDFEANVRERRITDGKKKEIKDTVPFSNVTHDFSAINGEVYWEEKELEYVFEITADTPEALEHKKIAFKSWIMNVMNQQLHDPFIKGYHFVATYKDNDVDDSEVEKSTITVKFSAYPYMVADKPKVYENVLDKTDSTQTKTDEVTVVVENKSSHRITPTFTSDVDFTLTMNGASYALQAGEFEDSSIKFAVGTNTITLQANEVGTVKISFYEEVF